MSQGGEMPKPGVSPKRRPFKSKVPRVRKAVRGRPQAGEAPLSIRRSGIATTAELEAYMRQRAGFKLGKFAPHVERVTVRLTDVNGPRGGVDTSCSIKVVLSGLPSVVVEELASGTAEAFDRAADRVERAVRRSLDRARDTGKIRRHPQPRGAASPRSREADAPESLIGRREGRSQQQLEKAAARPEKTRRDYYVDTSLPGVSATDRKAGGTSTARRNTKKRTSKATATLEDSLQERPSRKSTRRSANRAKQGSKLQRRQMQRVISPKSKARKRAAQRRA
jgi:hypothetical protein